MSLAARRRRVFGAWGRRNRECRMASNLPQSDSTPCKRRSIINSRARVYFAASWLNGVRRDLPAYIIQLLKACITGGASSLVLEFINVVGLGELPTED